MNILSFVALNYIGAGEFTVVAQLKILTTAGFSVLLLHTTLTSTKWRALALLVLGCVLVASPSFSTASTKATNTIFYELLGFGAVVFEVILSGFASIYFEKVVKSTTEVVTIWERNFQLSFYSIIMYLCILIFNENGRSTWQNWNWVTVVLSCLGAAGGLLVVVLF